MTLGETNPANERRRRARDPSTSGSAASRSLGTRLADACFALRPYVWCYGQHQGQVPGESLSVPLPARPKHVLSFVFGDRYRMRRSEGGDVETSPRAVIFGPQTRQRLRLVIGRRVDTFTIHFQPSGFHQLFGTPMGAFADAEHDARSVLGRSIPALEEQLAVAPSFEARCRVADAFLMARVAAARAPDPVAAAANHMFAANGALRVAALAAWCGLSARQFERRFFEQIGVTPKLYARITRFNAALDKGLGTPAATLTDLAHDLGFYDHMHMVHDFRTFAGDTPARFLARLHSVPEFHSVFATEDRLRGRRAAA